MAFPKYDKIFSDGYEKAMMFLKNNKVTINSVLTSKEERAVGLSVVFPEIIKYSSLIDYFQKSAMEIIYIKYGKEKADFSIGRFQMKPSFVENLEKYLHNTPALKDRFSAVFEYEVSSSKEKREKRIERLNSLAWQLVYLKCFYAIMNERFEDLEWKNKVSKIKFYAAAYNHDFLSDEASIRKWMDKKTFPYGVHSEKKQYAYSHISLYFYKKHWSSVQAYFEGDQQDSYCEHINCEGQDAFPNFSTN